MNNNKIYQDICRELEPFSNEYKGEYYLSPYNEKDESFEEIIDAYFERINHKEYTICEDTIFDSPGYTAGFICISWVDEEGLHSISERWEVV
jgi:hypothetical protein